MGLKRAAVWLLALLLLPAACSAGGTWATVTDSFSEDEIGLLDDEFTGTVTITFLGDCTLGGEQKNERSPLSFARRVADNGMGFPLGGLKALTEGDDTTVANLEVVLSDRKLKKEKKEFNFIGPTANTEVLRLGSVECVTLANNHTHDYGEEGYRDTREALEEAGIGWFSQDAPAVWQSGTGVMIGFLGVNYSLTGNRYKRYAAQAQRLREMGCAAVITVMHAGTEYSYTPPDAYQAQIVPRAVKNGSCLVIGHHPHVLQGVAFRDGIPVVYSLGNCSFGGNTYVKDPDALAVKAALSFREGKLTGIDLTFYPISVTSDSHYNNYSPKLLTGEDAERVLRKMADSTGVDPGTRNGDGSATLHVSFGDE